MTHLSDLNLDLSLPKSSSPKSFPFSRLLSLTTISFFIFPRLLPLPYSLPTFGLVILRNPLSYQSAAVSHCANVPTSQPYLNPMTNCCNHPTTATYQSFSTCCFDFSLVKIRVLATNKLSSMSIRTKSAVR